MKEKLLKFKAEHETLSQMILFTLWGGVATLVDLAVFSLLNFWLLKPLKTQSFVWWILDYNSATGGGLGGFIATAAAYICAQTANFFVQRRKTFAANNNVGASGAMFFVMITVLFFMQIWLGGIFMKAFAPVFGQALGDVLSRAADNTVSWLIQFPLNKFVIMRKNKG